MGLQELWNRLAQRFFWRQLFHNITHVAADDDKDVASKDRSSSSSSSSESMNFCLNDLPDLLIEEILLRLPTTKSAFLCKCVCKNWYSLISTPSFVHRFITRQYKDNPSALLFNYCLSKYRDYRIIMILDEHILKTCEFELKHLLHDDFVTVKVLDAYKDLILCALCREGCNVGSDGIFGGYVCNPFTKQWVALPLLKRDVASWTRIKFVSEPYYFEDNRGGCTLNWNYRFRVILMKKKSMFETIIWRYCSETQEWDRSVLNHYYHEWIKDAVAYNGKLLCYGDGRVFSYDSFNPELSTFTDCSCFVESTKLGAVELDPSSPYHLGVCKGVMRMMQLVGGRLLRKRLFIWEQMDFATWEWSLEEDIYLDTMVPESSLVQDFVSDENYTLELLGFHTSNRNVVYLCYMETVISCNTMTNELKIIGEIPCDHLFGRYDDLHIELPLWPTPIDEPIYF